MCTETVKELFYRNKAGSYKKALDKTSIDVTGMNTVEFKYSLTSNPTYSLTSNPTSSNRTQSVKG